MHLNVCTLHQNVNDIDTAGLSTRVCIRGTVRSGLNAEGTHNRAVSSLAEPTMSELCNAFNPLPTCGLID
jgi:hypothetical protein